MVATVPGGDGIPARCAACEAPTPPGARFCPSCGRQIGAPPEHAAPPSRPRPGPRAERRHLTVVFCDLVGSAELAASRDPEDVADVIVAFHRRVAEVVASFGGFVAQYAGDGVLAYFGYPRASEDDAERAVSAALAAVEAVAGIPAGGGLALRARSAVAAGVTVVGDMAGAGEPRGVDAIGEAPNLAARLQSIAAPGTVAVSDPVRRSLGNLFRWEDLGSHALKGWSAPVRAWRAFRPAAITDWFAARHPDSPGPMVGRKRELDLLLELWRGARAGRGRLVLVRGEPGIGKSRLVAELLRATVAEPHVRRRFHFSQHHQHAPLYPVTQYLEQVAGFAPNDSADTKRSKLEAVLPGVPEADVALIAELMLLPPSPGSPALPLSPQQRLRRTLQILMARFAALAGGQPLLTVTEDAHWSDPTTAELLRVVAARIGSLPILDVVTARPEFRPDWAGAPSVAVIDLEPLGPEDSAEIVRWTAGAETLPPAVVGGILARSDGVPLHLEEVTRAVVESGEHLARRPPGAGKGGGGGGRGPALPASLHASLLARLDRLGNTREVAEVAAAVGREFTAEMLGDVTGLPAPELQAALARLAESGLVVPLPATDPPAYRFKHALIQDAAYGTILRGRRRDLHARIARVLEERLPQDATAKPQLLARHWTEAGDAGRAIDWRLRAGLQSLRQSAAPEALEQLRQGLELVGALPEGEARDRREFDLRVARARAFVLASGNAAPAAGEEFARARALSERFAERPPLLLTVLHGEWTHAFMRGELASALEKADLVLAEGEARGDGEWTLTGCYGKGLTSLALGDLGAACDFLRRGLALLGPRREAADDRPLVTDPRVVMRGDLAWALLCLGRFDEAHREYAATMAEARALGQAFTIAHALSKVSYQLLNTAPPEAALAAIEEMRLISEEHGMQFYHALSHAFRGWCLSMLGDTSTGRALMASGIEAYRATGTLLYLPSLLRMEAEALRLDGDLRTGMARLEEATRLKERTGALWDEAEIERVRGDMLIARGDARAAEAAFESARRLAAARGARWFELRAATSLARLLGRQGRRPEAVAALAPIVAALDRAGEAIDLERGRQALLELRQGVPTPGQEPAERRPASTRA